MPGPPGAAARFPLAPAMNLLSELLPASHILLDVAAATSRRVRARRRLLFENEHRTQASAGVRQPVRARTPGLDRPGPRHRHSARPHQGSARRGRRVRAHAARRSRSTRRTGSRCNLIFVLLVPENATDLHLQILSRTGADVQRPGGARAARRSAGCAGRAASDRRLAGAGQSRMQRSDRPMPQVSVAQLFEDNRDALKLSWVAGEARASARARQHGASISLTRA